MFPSKRNYLLGLILFGVVIFSITALACSMGAPAASPKAEIVGATAQPVVDSGNKAPPKRAKASDTWTSPKDGTVLVYVPAGEFLMGAREFDEQIDPDEIPMHKVTLDGFWIDQTEVTHAQFAIFLTEMGNHGGSATWFEADSGDAWIEVLGPNWVADAGWEDHPVHEVTWFGAEAYCQWVGRRLPTEAEWEKAARGTEGLVYPWGNIDPNCSMANMWDGDNVCAETGVSAPVGSFPAGASPYGALDMAGNVWEWVADWYGKNYYANSPAENPTGPDGGVFKVTRGGSWESGARNLRTTDRKVEEPAGARYRLGFRCALSQ